MDEAIFNIIRSNGTDFVLWFFCTYLSHSQFSSALILVVGVIQRLHYCNSMSRSETLSNFPNVTFDLQIYSIIFWHTFTFPLAIISILISYHKQKASFSDLLRLWLTLFTWSEVQKVLQNMPLQNFFHYFCKISTQYFTRFLNNFFT